MNRRHFIMQALVGAAVVGTPIIPCLGESTQPSTTKPARPEVRGQPHLDPDLVFEFVGAGHGNLVRVRELLSQETPSQ